MIEQFAFTPEEGFLSGTAYPAEPDSEEAAREQLMRPHAQVREYINGTLLRALADSTAAGALGAAELFEGDDSEQTVQGKLLELRQEIEEISQGGIPDGSITTEKLAATLTLDGGAY